MSSDDPQTPDDHRGDATELEADSPQDGAQVQPDSGESGDGTNERDVDADRVDADRDDAENIDPGAVVSGADSSGAVYSGLDQADGSGAFDSGLDEDADDEDEDDDDDSLWISDESDQGGYVEISRSGPGWAMSRWIISAAVAAVVVIGCFVLIPRMFSPSDSPANAGKSGAPASEGSLSAAPSSAAPTLTYPEVVAQSGPVHYWQFELEDAGGDSVGEAQLEIGAEAAVLGSSAYVGGSGSVDCSGTWGSRAPSTLAETPAGDFTIEAWIDTISNRGGPIVTFANPITGMMPDRVLYVGADGRAYFGALDQFGTPYFAMSPDTVNTGSWHHLVATMSSTTGLTLYIDGNPVANEPAGTTVNSVEGYWTICGDAPSGWPSDTGQSAFTGTVDDVSVYSKALSPEEVKAHYDAAETS
ncbi:LamG domain-containing protein [Cumulibacter soli]|uniref:LamG domain-containing protein n=1 Tax=Cumulibacter soli TaxID=2546344 RepID=UPI001067AF00|nr:LamG domain-containing protein [Cumulibacter soli]